MLFNSYIFLFCFLPITWILFRFACAMRVTDVALAVLTVASLAFYSYWNPPFVFLILFSVLFNYAWGRIIERNMHAENPRKIWLFSGVAVNLGLIAYFKYANFFMSNLAALGGGEWTSRSIFLPLGISFFTFQQIAYLIDCSKGKAREHTFTHYALFVTFFPQLIAGPIVRYDQIMPQFARLRTFGLSYRNIALGIALLSLGLFKKLVIADTLSPWVAALFDSSSAPTFFEAWAGTLSYTFQIYFDFSGYSDMALGLGKLFNIDLPLNFNSPYKATSVIEFWRRWHISLSTFLKDYLYIPLGGSRKGTLRRYGNLMITMLLGGLWHGASWNFVIWGGLHGMFLSVNHLFRSLTRNTPPRMPRWAGWLFTFTPVVFAWVFFRATSFSRAWEILKGMLGLHGFVLPPQYMPIVAIKEIMAKAGVIFSSVPDWTLIGGKREILLLGLCLIMCLFLPNSYECSHFKSDKKAISILCVILIGGILALDVSFLNRTSEFLYFQF